MDRYSKEIRSRVMSRIHSKDTKPELIVRRYLYSRGYRYRKNVKCLPGTPDIVMKKYQTIIFIHGCFWHGHDKDGHLPKSNTEYWRAKIEHNKKRDTYNKDLLTKMEWNVITIWECQLKPAVRKQTLKELEFWINKSFLNKFAVHKSPLMYVLDDDENKYSEAAEDPEKYRL
jgi:DNA mismatch endonuclease, patch repair protein